MKKLIIIAGLFLIAIGGFIAFKMYNKKHSDLSKIKAEHHLSSVKIFEEFSIDEQSANVKFLNKPIEVSGEIAKIEKAGGGSQNVYLKSDDLMFGVICEMAPGQVLNDLKNGDNVVIRGLCSGYLMDVALNRCVIVND